MPIESDDNCQHASCASRKLALLIGEGLKYIIVFTDIILNLLCPNLGKPEKIATKAPRHKQ
jgi:hypothetical protein